VQQLQSYPGTPPPSHAIVSENQRLVKVLPLPCLCLWLSLSLPPMHGETRVMLLFGLRSFVLNSSSLMPWLTKLVAPEVQTVRRRDAATEIQDNTKSAWQRQAAMLPQHPSRCCSGVLLLLIVLLVGR